MRLPVKTLAEKYQEHVFRAAFSVSRNPQDAEDVVQETFLSYMESSRQFENEEHIRAWLLRTAINKSKNILRSLRYREDRSFEDYMEQVPFESSEDRELVETVLSMPKTYRIPIYLYYYEGYSVNEIAEILHLSANTVKSRLFRGRKELKRALNEEDFSDDNT